MDTPTGLHSSLRPRTRKIIPTFCRSKDEIQDKWIFTAKAEQKKLLADIITFKRDGAGELTSNNIGQFLEEQGIISRVTEPYNSVTNPQAERFVRTVNTKARALLLESNLPEEFWPNAVQFACMCYNNTARHFVEENKWISPEKLWT
eukprot:TRINITY_DN2159_c1_g1_i3.p2 TRINITY_DN2159_c1_g1~~TRINITY_DN2159_c1_g1_i3.p2  ORF type:complete len:147 (+),score=29.71 TRINITY_DN2159_c1_g1_i3:213-653(+)